jgi:hypothetical protein
MEGKADETLKGIEKKLRNLSANTDLNPEAVKSTSQSARNYSIV